jgi:monothiol glutaredoxin
MRLVGVLEQLGVEYGAVDVLPVLDPLREVTGEIADWRTFPQLYVNGTLVGGCDIVEEMFESGELAELLEVEQSEGVAPAPAPEGSDPQQSPPLQLG